MKFIHILSCILLLPRAASAANPPYVVVMEKIKNGNSCTVQVSLNCVYTDENGVEQPCLSETDTTPFLHVREDKCGEEITAKITMTVCNLNTQQNAAIRPNLDLSEFVFRGEEFNVPALNSNIMPGKCIEFVKEDQKIDTCIRNHPMSVKLVGSLANLNEGESYCYGYAHRKNRIRHYPAPQQGESEIFADCSIENEGTGHVCNSTVSISCSYVDSEDGLVKSCVSVEDDVPFHSVRQDKCAANPLTATVTMTMCNVNNNGNIITPFQPPEDTISTYFRFRGNTYDVPNTYDDIQASNCRTLTRIEKIDTCRKNWPMSVQLKGNMTKSVEGNSYCYCYLHRKSKIDIFPAPPNPSTPSPSPPTGGDPLPETAAPSVRVTSAPTKKAATPSPTSAPTKKATLSPVSSPVPVKPIIITEISDPKKSVDDPNDVPRFVEMYVPDVILHGGKIQDDLKLVIFPGSSMEPDWSTLFDLKDSNVTPDGFISICNEAGRIKYSGKCSHWIPRGNPSPVNINGCYNVAIIEGDATEYRIVDMYGVRGRACEGTISDFSDGRAVRLDNATLPEADWDQYDWEIIKGEDIEGINDPGDWNPEVTPCDPNDIIITELSFPEGLSSSRYVELYIPNCSGQRIKPGVKLVRWPEGSSTPSVNHVPLQNVVVPNDGFVVICQSDIAETTFNNFNLCDVIGGNGNPTGKDSVLVVDGVVTSSISSMNVVDLYGNPGSSGLLSSDFTNGRAVRYRPNIPVNSGASWNLDEWTVYPSNDGKNTVGPEGMDPRVWVNPIIITEISDPDISGASATSIPRFIEMYVPDEGMRSRAVTQNLKLVVFPGGSDEPDWNKAYDLKSKVVDSKGFITLCNSAANNRYKDSCSDVAFANTAVNEDGCYNVAIVYGDSERYSVIDMYGIRGKSCSGTISDFSDGRAVRLDNTTYPESGWDQYNWEIIKGEDIEGINDPGDWNPEVTPCDPNDIIITELSDPKSKGESSYVELYLPNCSGQRIKPGVKLVRWPEGSSTPSVNHVPLQNVVVPNDGFVLICRSQQATLTFGDKTCDVIAGGAVPSGKDALAVVNAANIDSIPSSAFIDSYGYPGAASSISPLPSDFTDGRAVRVKPLDPTNSGALWAPGQWIVYPGKDGKNEVGPKGMDPRVWINPAIITEITDPVTTSPGEVPRIVELYFPDLHVHGKEVKDNLKLVVFVGTSDEPDWSTAYDLKDETIDADGFMTVCNKAGKEQYGQLCDIVSAPGSPTPADKDGCYVLAVVQGDSLRYSIVDVYGIIGVNCAGTIFDFSDGKAVRLTNATYPESSWEKYHWKLVRGATPDMADPDVWVDDIPSSFCNLIITELASPNDDVNARYVELYSDNCAGRTIGDNFKLINYDGGDGIPEPVEIDLEGLVIGHDGFLVLCSTDQANLKYDGKCDLVVGPNTPVDNDGDESVAIVLEYPSSEPGIIDIYGRPDRDGSFTDQDFTGGRAVRDTSATEPSDEWNPDDWYVIPGGRTNTADVDDMDPRLWENPPLQVFITELADPSDTAANRFIEIYSPSHAGKIIEDDLMLIRFEGSSDSPISEYVCLKGIKFNRDGFMVFCRMDSTWPDDRCEHKLPMSSVANVQGTDDVAIVRGSCTAASEYDSIVDIFGVPGVGVAGPNADQIFSRGRAVRRKDVDEAPKSVFDAADWIILPGTNGNLVDSDGCDPNEWNDVIEPDPIPSDPDLPSSPSSSKSSKGKGNTLSPKSSSKGKGNTLSPKSSSKGKGSTLSPKSSSKGKGNTLSPKSPSKGKSTTLSPKSPSKGKDNTLSPKSPSKGKDTTLSPKSPKLSLPDTKTPAPKDPKGKRLRKKRF